MTLQPFDSNFDYRSDSPGQDPDSASATLQRDHITLWSKPLPSGHRFLLEKDPGGYLIHTSELGSYQLSSDTIVNSWRSKSSLQPIISMVPNSLLDEFQRLGATAGGRILFPRTRVDGETTINVARGFSRQISDRFDLTLECIRRHYNDEASPLDVVLARYRSFFQLFGSFNGYVDFFLLNDLVINGKVEYFLSFDGTFLSTPLPNSPEEYQEYAEKSMDFVIRRSKRLTAWHTACFEVADK